MVFESVLKEKPPEYNTGPGDYDLNQTDIKTQLSNSLNLHKNRPPFNQSSIRGSKDKLNDYYILKDEQLNLENPINLYDKKTFNTYLNDKTTKNISFLSGQDRFHYKTTEKETLDDLKLLEEGSLTTDYSIPYDIEKKLKKKYTKSERIYNKIGTNPESEKIKEDYIKEKNKKKIGPGEYDINPKWNKNIVKWSGLTEIRLKTENKDFSKKPTENDIEKEQLNINLQHKIKNMKTDLFRSIQNRRKESYIDLIEERRKIILKNEVDDDPYIKPGLFDKNPQNNKNQRYQFFGSTSLRKNYNQISTTNENVGPGYYNYNYNYFGNRSLTGPKNNKRKKNDRKIIYKTKPGIYGLVIGNNENYCDNEDKKKINFEDLYEIERDFKFGTQEVRFRNKRNNESNVGPGEYYHEENWIKNNKNNNSNYNFIHMSKKNKNNDNIKDNKENDNFFKNEECSPGAGAYEISKSIEKDYQKFKNRYKNNKVPFSSNTQRFYYDNLNNKNQILENNNFEFYLPKEKKIVGGLINPIAMNKRLNSQLFDNGSNGPGQYMLDSFFDWNKKTYNIKYA